MSPVRHPVTGPTLHFSLADEIRTVREQLATSVERSARTLVKDGALRATLIGLNPGGTLKAHQADGPITVHVLEGAIEFEVDGQRWPLPAGSLFALDRGIVHSVSSVEGGVFLLTVALAKASPTGAGETH